MAIDGAKIKELREKTSAGILDCKNALEETNGDIDKAADLLREKGIVKAVKKMGREAAEGSMFSYIHHNGKIGVLLELNCETDFVARNDKFKELGKDICMHIAAANPGYLTEEDVPQEEIDKEKKLIITELKDEGKPENMLEKIAEGKLNKFYSEIVLLKQGFVKEPKTSIENLVKASITTLGENISIGKFVRYSF